ncbi:glycerate kinase [Romboutsia ilealis]|uniref:Glycerate kinase n=1 Tax=Romboutsia faecis TaxID=2764597 RepID=A0ABR7JQM3_9FIRM|nr:glycerate kinase [Romboutsia faecis]MBC5997087.1 glycerate kinase [Romboutsia faecis]MRN26209.1 glycerate kinase [Romboutsia ilealis]
MKFVLAPDSFKESLTAQEVADAMEIGIKKVFPNAECVKVPMADGGEGTVQSLVDGTDGKIYEVAVTGPLGKIVNARYGILGDNETAVIEMAEASGIHYVEKEKRNPLITTTYGTGEVIKEALNKGVKKIIIGIGGSATNDGGAGMIQALGGRLLDKEGNDLSFGGGSLDKLDRIDLTKFDERINKVKVEVACDVNNTLTGEEGASAIFGPQKGATPDLVKLLDKNLGHYAQIVKEQLGKDMANEKGAGAAGGLGFALLTFCNGELKPGIDIVIEYSNLDTKIQGASYVLTGEGSIDGQTKFGKTPYGVAQVAKKYDIPVIAVAGNVGSGTEELYGLGFNSILSIMPGVMTLDKALVTGKKNIENTVENIARLLEI